MAINFFASPQQVREALDDFGILNWATLKYRNQSVFSKSERAWQLVHDAANL